MHVPCVDVRPPAAGKTSGFSFGCLCALSRGGRWKISTTTFARDRSRVDDERLG
jgi:hypothetical protein